MASGTGIKYGFCNLSSGQFVAGRLDKTPTFEPFGRLYDQNNLNLVIYPLEINPSARVGFDPYTQLSVSGVSLSAYIFDSTGTTVLASQTVFTADAAAGTLSGTLNLNTAAMVNYAPTVTGKDVIIEFRFVTSIGTITVSTPRPGDGTGTPAKVYKQFNVSGSPVAVANETYLSENQTRALFVLREGLAGQSFTLLSADGTQKILCYCDNDGVFRTDLIT